MTEHAHTLVNELIDAARFSDSVTHSYFVLDGYISQLESGIQILRSECQNILKSKRESFDDTEEFFQWARNRALCALSSTENLTNTP